MHHKYARTQMPRSCICNKIPRLSKPSIDTSGLSSTLGRRYFAMEGRKVYTLSQVFVHRSKGDCWFVIGGKVYDVTKFLEEHPGGEEVLIEASGSDATKDFEDVGHSRAAKEMMSTYQVGVLEGYKFEDAGIRKEDASVKWEKTAFKEVPAFVIKDDEPSTRMKLLQFLVPLLIVGIAFGVRSVLKEGQLSS